MGSTQCSCPGPECPDGIGIRGCGVHPQETGTQDNKVGRSPGEVPQQERPWAAKGQESSYSFLSSGLSVRQGPPGSTLRISEPACHSVPVVFSSTCLLPAVLRLGSPQTLRPDNLVYSPVSSIPDPTPRYKSQ